jgi:hypothetical protein
MSNDSKCGLILGVALVILIAVLFFRRDAAHGKPPEAASVAVKPGTLPAPGLRRPQTP